MRSETRDPCKATRHSQPILTPIGRSDQFVNVNVFGAIQTDSETMAVTMARQNLSIGRATNTPSRSGRVASLRRSLPRSAASGTRNTQVSLSQASSSQQLNARSPFAALWSCTAHWTRVAMASCRRYVSGFHIWLHDRAVLTFCCISVACYNRFAAR